MHPATGNDLKTFLLHRTAFLCVSRFLRLASFGTVNALMITISVTFQPLSSVIPKIFCNFVLGSHSDYQFFRHLYFIELTLNYLLYI